MVNVEPVPIVSVSFSYAPMVIASPECSSWSTGYCRMRNSESTPLGTSQYENVRQLVETETQWHRNWKNKFPIVWQEIFLHDEQTGELHIADVRTEHGLVIEFQHSHIKPEERISRENFYKNMVWVVDGTRLTRDYPRFVKASKEFSKVNEGIFQHHFADECFPRQWLHSDVPVIFDFLGNESPDTIDEIKRNLYCLFPMTTNLNP